MGNFLKNASLAGTMVEKQSQAKQYLNDLIERNPILKPGESTVDLGKILLVSSVPYVLLDPFSSIVAGSGIIGGGYTAIFNSKKTDDQLLRYSRVIGRSIIYASLATGLDVTISEAAVENRGIEDYLGDLLVNGFYYLAGFMGAFALIYKGRGDDRGGGGKPKDPPPDPGREKGKDRDLYKIFNIDQTKPKKVPASQK